MQRGSGLTGCRVTGGGVSGATWGKYGQFGSDDCCVIAEGENGAKRDKWASVASAQGFGLDDLPHDWRGRQWGQKEQMGRP